MTILTLSPSLPHPILTPSSSLPNPNTYPINTLTLFLSSPYPYPNYIPILTQSIYTPYTYNHIFNIQPPSPSSSHPYPPIPTYTSNSYQTILSPTRSIHNPPQPIHAPSLSCHPQHNHTLTISTFNISSHTYPHLIHILPSPLYTLHPHPHMSNIPFHAQHILTISLIHHSECPAHCTDCETQVDNKPPACTFCEDNFVVENDACTG